MLGNTALHWAVKGGHLAMVRLLLEHRADPSVRDVSGKTALRWTIELSRDTGTVRDS